MILGIPDLTPLVKVAVEHETSLQVLQYAFVNSSPEVVRVKLELFLPELCTELKDMEKPLRLQVFGFLGDLLTRIPPEVRPIICHITPY